MRSSYLFILITILSMSSCSLKKKMVYFQTEVGEATAKSYTPVFKADDLLSIVVKADNLESAIPFNLPVTNSISSANGYSQGNSERDGYLVDENGNIDFPIFGKIHLAGLRRIEATELLANRLSEYLQNPIVNIQILNFKVTILGDVSKPGTYKIPNERMTVLEALGLSGDLNITGKRQNILVIRDNEGVKEQFRIDLTNTEEVFTSPAYYLQQNDVVYVEPNANQRTFSSFWRTSASIFISIAGVIISTISVITK